MDQIAIVIPRYYPSAVKQLHNNIGDMEEITDLSSDLHINAVHGDDSHLMSCLDNVETDWISRMDQA